MVRIKWVTAECRKMRMAHSICLGHFRSKEKAKKFEKGNSRRCPIRRFEKRYESPTVAARRPHFSGPRNDGLSVA
ncbi:hypothetical protein [Burkholderia territorii]|uniref:hypothetical protein n=1 Tax=Burkholderia territorii TaxID=1503055 RepID=UPI0018C5B931|nr:hypothetical protein [Burkholderia territorii]